ncbi:MAG TPA: MBL fold metallo-hydrolase [Gemmatimonadaceae bacterium]|nr:MBL fold metallo-hydrolase [Gemmatimonadaceae bacterium]
MILRQFLHTDPVVAASYLVGCGGQGVAAVIDPVGDPSLYLRSAAESGMAIRYVIDTHVHADHISSGSALAMHAGARYVLHAHAGATYDFFSVHDGERLKLGNVVADVLHVPGHTPEHIALVVTDRTRSEEAWVVFTGHTLMVGDMGRTELATSAEEGARALFASAERLRALPDYVSVLPGAFSGSVCGRGLSGNPISTIGFERRFNRAFAITDREQFITHMMRDIPPPPVDAAVTRALNLGIVKPTGHHAAAATGTAV